MRCPNCQSKVESEQVNIQKDVAQCITCDHVFTVSNHVQPTPFSAINRAFNLTNPPKGVDYLKENREHIITVSTRSPAAFFLVPFLLLWSGGSLGIIYGNQFIKGEFDLFYSLFGIPFLIGSIGIGGVALMTLIGKIKFKINNTGGEIFTGVGSIGFTKSFEWKNIDSIYEGESKWKKGQHVSTMIFIQGAKLISIGFGLNNNKRQYILQSLLSFFKRKKDGFSI